MSVARVLSIAGSDPSGGAGIQADLKAIAANGGYGMCAITALTAQNTRGVQSVFTPPAAALTAQLDSISADIAIDAVKIGMLGGAGNIAAVAAWLRRAAPPRIVLDPVMVATSGDRLLDRDAEAALRGILPLAHLLTPNLAELGALTGEGTAPGWPAALAQARRLARETGALVLVKGGHAAPGIAAPSTAELAVDALVTPDGETTEFAAPRIRTRHTHGTGCSLSSAIATQAARRDGDWAAAVGAAKGWLTESLAAADALRVGSGNGPIHHFSGMWARAGIA